MFTIFLDYVNVIYMINRTHVRILTGAIMKEIENIGFIFVEKELIYLNNNLNLDVERLYISSSLGNTTDTNSIKED